MKKVAYVFSAFALAIAVLLSYQKYNEQKQSKESISSSQTKGGNVIDSSTEDKAVNYDEFKLSVVGDIMIHDTQLESQLDPKTGKYNFENNFTYVRKYIENADAAVANFETVLGGSGKRYSGFPTFNSPDEIADALSYAKFDVLSTANNHILDCGVSGLQRTNSILRNKGFTVLGTRENDKESTYTILERNNIKVGMVNYVFETAKVGNQKSINSIPIPKSAEELLDTFNYNEFDKNLEGMKKRIAEIRTQGADFIVFFMHWGEEYQESPNAYQKTIAQKLSDAGVDIIIGGHPHVLQPLSLITGKDGRKTYVAYSTGNFLSNQCYERLQRREPEDGMILNLNLRKDRNTNKVYLGDISYIPTWVHRKPNGNLFVYEILPLTDALKEEELYGLGEADSIQRAENSMKRTDTIMTSLISTPFDIPVFKFEGK